MSLYGLTIEPHTPLGRWKERGELDAPPDEQYETEFLMAHETLSDAGFDHYEVSNFARPGRRARHNSAYWTRVPYLGLGPSAHGFDGAERRWNEAAYVEWQRQIDRGSDPLAGRELLTAGAAADERAYLGLRTNGGLTLTNDEVARVSPWIDQGWAAFQGGNRVVLTPQGWLRLDALAADLTVVRSRY